MMALQFMWALQAEAKEEMPLLAVSALKLIFAQKLARKISSNEGLEKALSRRHKQRKADMDRYTKAPE